MKDKKAIVWQIWLLNCAISKIVDLIKWQLSRGASGRAILVWNHVISLIAFSSKSKMTCDCCVVKFLPRSMDGKHLMRFQNENAVFQFLRRCVDGVWKLQQLRISNTCDIWKLRMVKAVFTWLKTMFSKSPFWSWTAKHSFTIKPNTNS